MSNSSVATNFRADLYMATGRDFERKLLPFLRVFWPSIGQPTPLGSWDAKGIDLLVWDHEGPFPCVVQCKGFVVREIGYDQKQQAIESIETFRQSGEKCDTYLLIHNRNSENRRFYTEVRQHLDQLILENKASKAEIWDVRTVIDRFFERLEEMIIDALTKRSQELMERTQNLFRFGKHYVPMVPVNEKKMVFSRGQPCTLQDIHPNVVDDVSQDILARTDVRWTLLVGTFGSGKSTTALRAALASGLVIYVSSSTLEASYDTMGQPHKIPPSTNILLQAVAQSLKLIDEEAFEEQDREIIYRSLGPALLGLLRRPGSPYIFFLDGLDETRAYTNLAGIQTLSNQLVDLKCPIILTTRSEHLASMFGDFSAAFYEFSTKQGQHRTARLLELAPWSLNEVNQLLNLILLESTGTDKERLLELQQELTGTEHSSLYGQLPLNPLFLHFILEDVIEEGIRPGNRPSLIFAWVRRKIERDRTTITRPSPNDFIDMEDFVDRMLQLMENVANKMTQESEKKYQLIEAVSSDYIEEEARNLFHISSTSSDIVLAVLLNSVLIAPVVRRGSKLPLTFIFRLFHEFFLACYLVRKHIPVLGYPDTVEQLYQEIKAYLEADPSSSIAAHFHTY